MPAAFSSLFGDPAAIRCERAVAELRSGRPVVITGDAQQRLAVIALDSALHNNDRAYYLMVPERKAESAALKAFRDWLLAQADAYRGASSSLEKDRF